MEKNVNLNDFAALSSISESFSHAGQDYIFSHCVHTPDMSGEKRQSQSSSPIRFDGATLVLVKKGTLDITINSEVYTLNAGDIAVTVPVDLINATANPGEFVDIYTLFLSLDFLKGINFDLSVLQPSHFIKKGPVVRFNPDEQRMVIDYLNLLHECATNNDSGHNQLGVIARSIGRNIVVALLYQLAYFSAKSYISQDLVANLPAGRSRKLNYVHEFIRIVEQNFRRERNVAFYADSLCITPKYLSLLVKEVTGHSAASIIDQYVITEAKNMLRFSGDTIQQVAYKLNFANQSAFGKYFKHLTGQSPTVFRTT